MRLTAFPVVESGIEFNFSAALWCDKHDQTNTVFPGVDFIVEEPDRQVWLEVKNWEPATLTARRRGGQRRAFLAAMASNVYFRDTLRSKFIGTCAYLFLTGAMPSKEILYITLLESPRMDSYTMDTRTIKLRALVRRNVWQVPVDAAVVDLARWNAAFPQYSARAL